MRNTCETVAAVSGRPFIKMHGLRNHFVIVDARSTPWRPDADTVRQICDVHIGVGADQLVVLEPPGSDRADVFMRLYNVDGREVGACGNATRCVAWLVMEEQGADEAGVETLAGVLACRRSGRLSVTVDMGSVTSDWHGIPLSRDVDTTRILVDGAPGEGIALNVGNPHVVFFVDDPYSVELESIAPRIQADPLFPEQVNVGVAAATGRRSLSLRVFERGAGLTMACGSGACAAVRAAQMRGFTDGGPVEVGLPGGTVAVEIDTRGHAIMTGPVAFSFSGRLP